MRILFALFVTAMIVLTSLHAIQQFRTHPVVMMGCCLVAFLLMYVLF